MPRIDFEYDPSVIAEDTAQFFLHMFVIEAATALAAEPEDVVGYGRKYELRSGPAVSELGILYGASKIAKAVEEEWRHVPTIYEDAGYEQRFQRLPPRRSEDVRRAIAEQQIRAQITQGLMVGARVAAESTGIPEGTPIVLTATPTDWDIVDDIWAVPPKLEFPRLAAGRYR